MRYVTNHIPMGDKRPGTPLEPSYITIHSTANLSSTAKNERNWLVNPTNTRIASWHICVGETEAVEAIPLNEVAYHAGTAAGNANSISIEMCESGNRHTVINNTADLVAEMLFKRGWGIDRLKRHYDWSGKNCPRILNLTGDWQGWENFKTIVAVKLSELVNVDEEVAAMAETRYNKVDELPDWAEPTVQKLIDKGFLVGDGVGFNLSLDMIRMLVLHDRAGLYN
jgi:N-acetylmuramoyl-L-alanine amidase